MKALLAFLLLAIAIDWREAVHADVTQRAKIGGVHGIDVSHHQGKIDWPAVRKAGMEFAFIKATEGATFRDSRFADNWKGANDAGLLRGAYHFFTFCREGDEQAENFVSVVPADANALPPVVDLEFGGNCAVRPTPKKLCASLQKFLDRIEPALGKKAILYVTDESLPAFGECLPDRPLWFRPLVGGTPSKPIVIWQFNDQITIPGIEGIVDFNTFLGDHKALESLRDSD